MTNKKCKDVMSNPAHVCEENDSVEQCAKLMEKHSIGFVPVINSQKKVVGIVTNQDLAIRVVGQKKSSSTPVNEIMTKGEVPTCRGEEDFEQAGQKMEKGKRSHILVTNDQGQPQGVIGLAEIAQHEKQSRAGQIFASVKPRSASTHA